MKIPVTTVMQWISFGLLRKDRKIPLRENLSVKLSQERAAAVTQGAVAKGRSVKWQDVAANDGACSLSGR